MRGERLTLVKKNKSFEESETAKFRDFSIAKSPLQNDETFLKEPLEFDIVVANTLERRKDCYKLACDEYRKKGYVKDDEQVYFVNQYDLVQGLITFAARDKNKKIIGTITVIPDSELKLPSDLVFENEIDMIRIFQKNLFEISRLVVHSDVKNQDGLLAAMMNYCVVYAHHFLQADSGIIEVNPRHCAFYEKYLLMEKLTDIRLSPFVDNAPAILLKINVDKMIDYTTKARDLELYPFLKRTYFPSFFRDHSEAKIKAYIENAFNALSEEEKHFFGL